ncbi:hypothetical protein GOC83_19415 [Haloarcula rubripromontorii]|uniref:Uncharacterized protein n=1 Tax=Haloarcula rubripromontorii TaxID=1705562 RepID=A0A847U5K9_9EURY|nr:hypothetical protein [Haloarcula rubripromontorii]NLV08289.1 hypothetical protein [Haloarcula rubripromontorii]
MRNPRTPLDEILLDVQIDDGATAAVDVSFTPALDKLNDHQRTWLSTWTETGYESRRELLLSLHQMQFWSLGRVPDGWFVDVCSKPVLLSVVITSENRYRWREDPVDLATAADERRQLAAKYIRPAFRTAYRKLRTEAQQYTNESERVEDVDSTAFFAMRPALDELYRKQSDLLVSLLDGFDDMTAVDDWLSRLDKGTLGELYKIEPDFDWKIHDRPSAQRVLLIDEPKYEQERVLWGAVYLLPAYNRAVERWAEEADEHREDDADETHPSRTM